VKLLNYSTQQEITGFSRKTTTYARFGTFKKNASFKTTDGETWGIHDSNLPQKETTKILNKLNKEGLKPFV